MLNFTEDYGKLKFKKVSQNDSEEESATVAIRPNVNFSFANEKFKMTTQLNLILVDHDHP